MTSRGHIGLGLLKQTGRIRGGPGGVAEDWRSVRNRETRGDRRGAHQRASGGFRHIRFHADVPFRDVRQEAVHANARTSSIYDRRRVKQSGLIEQLPKKAEVSRRAVDRG